MIGKSLDTCFKHRVFLLIVFAVVTVVFGFFATRVNIETIFADLLPQDHAYIQIHNEFGETYGSSNRVSLMVEVAAGEIMTAEHLATIKALTDAAALAPAADPFQVRSIASRKTKAIRSSTEGVDTRPLMFPDTPTTSEDIAELRNAITNDPMIYGALVSDDFKAALITVDFFERLMDYGEIFEYFRALGAEHETDNLKVRLTGEPILYGWVLNYLGETVRLALMTLAALLIFLFIISRTWHGMAIPVIAAAISATWAIGLASLANYNLDPLVIVVAFILTALAISNSVQVVQRFEFKMRTDPSAGAPAASRRTLQELGVPAFLAVMSSLGCMVVVAVTPIPLLQKIAVVGGFWVLSLGICAILLPAILASWVRRPEKYSHAINLKPLFHAFLDKCARLATSGWRFLVIGVAVVVFLTSALYAMNITVGDTRPGSTILTIDSAFNRDAAVINETFQGSDQMFVVFSSDEEDIVKKPRVLASFEELKRYMEAENSIGGSESIADILRAYRRALHEGNPAYFELGNDEFVNAELAYMYVAGSDPGDAEAYFDYDFSNASLRFYFRDRQGDTIRSALSRAQAFIDANPIVGGEYQLAGGYIGVLGAVNEVILSGQIRAIAICLLVLILVTALMYRSTLAGLLFTLPVILSNTITFSYMAYQGIGISINTLPVVALGIGLGVDYSFYVVDAIRQDFKNHGDLSRAIRFALNSAGQGVLITVLTLLAGMALWSLSSLRLQSEMAGLIALWISVSALASLILMPALVYTFKPKFVVGVSEEKVATRPALQSASA